jgi:hypothetical protein
MKSPSIVAFRAPAPALPPGGSGILVRLEAPLASQHTTIIETPGAVHQ